PLTRADYRRRAIAANDATYGAANTAAITSLQKIGLTVRGSGSAGALVINGTVTQLRRALSLDCIRTATLDRSLELVSPHGKRKVRRPRNG
ncbi:MAG: hypothetical protein P8N43_03630, partial [Alphaproteobacteria bacterium]|nr:hypothetical protein [Alphaproteobacteria bacterium]